MCQKCGKSCGNKCSSSSDSANIESTVSELQDTVQQLYDAAKFLLCGHPIMLIQNSSDIESFDFVSGAGFDCWEGWAICDGGSHMSSLKKSIVTPNFTDRFIVQAGGNYQVGDTGGADTVQLSVAEMPIHSHGITDPGHTHTITDPGHDHGVTDPGHNHGATGGSHTHGFVTDNVGDHTHGTGYTIIGDNNTGSNFNALNDGISGSSTGPAGGHSHSGTTNAAACSVSVSDAFTGVDINPSFTGSSNVANNTDITVNNEGGDTAHENRPPYYAAIYVMRIG